MKTRDSNLRWFLYDEQTYRIELSGLVAARKKQKNLANRRRRQLKKRVQKFGHLVRVKEDTANKVVKEYVFAHPTLDKDFLIDPHYANNATDLSIAQEIRCLELARAFILGIPYKQFEPRAKKNVSYVSVSIAASKLLQKGLHFDKSFETYGWFILCSIFLPEAYMSKKIIFEKKDFHNGMDSLCTLCVVRWLNGKDSSSNDFVSTSK